MNLSLRRSAKISCTSRVSAVMSTTDISDDVIALPESPPSRPPSSSVSSVSYGISFQLRPKENTSSMHASPDTSNGRQRKLLPFTWRLRVDFRKFNCDLCGRRFGERSKLRRHLNAVHHATAQGRYLCDLCGDPFTLRYDLEAHLRRHHQHDVIGS